jgi:hypothetical protein
MVLLLFETLLIDGRNLPDYRIPSLTGDKEIIDGPREVRDGMRSVCLDDSQYG